MSRRKHAICISNSSDSEDECLLQLANKKRKTYCSVVMKYNINSQNELCLKSHQSCEFCDKTFESRLQSLVHNAKHIIIPLIKCDIKEKHHNVAQTSQTKMSPKLSNNVPFVNNRIILGGKPKVNGIQSRIIFEDDNDDVIVLSDSDSDVKEENTNKNVLNSFVSDCTVLLDDPMALFNSKNNEFANGHTTLLSKLTSDCKVDIGQAMPLWNEVQNTELVSRILPPEDPKWSSSIHNDDLLRPGFYKCDICKVHFPNRFEVIKHKAKHLTVRRASHGLCIVCEKFRRRRLSPLCISCHHRHRTRSEAESEPEPEPDPDPEIVNDETFQKICLDTTETKIMKLCEVCYMFLMRRSNQLRLLRKKMNENYKYTKVSYAYEGHLTDTGVKHTCDGCQHGFSEVKIVQKSRKHFYKTEVSSVANKIHFENENEFKPVMRLSKLKSNEGRLNRIKNRMRKIKGINKF